MKREELISTMEWLMGPTWYIDETKPHMRQVKADERDKLNLRYNKLRGTLFSGVISYCWAALDYLPNVVRDEYKKRWMFLNMSIEQP